MMKDSNAEGQRRDYLGGSNFIFFRYLNGKKNEAIVILVSSLTNFNL